MLLWVLLAGALAAAVAVGIVAAAMRRAERRTRRSLFRALGISEQTIELLMDHKGDVLDALDAARRPRPRVDPGQAEADLRRAAPGDIAGPFHDGG